MTEPKLLPDPWLPRARPRICPAVEARQHDAAVGRTPAGSGRHDDCATDSLVGRTTPGQPRGAP